MAIQISVETLSPITHNQIPVITTGSFWHNFMAPKLITSK